ncbi:MAG: MEDS domain-containing protein, partial [Acidimicrobiales bacterium]
MGADFGLPGVEFTRSTHVCALYFGEAERDDNLLPFLRPGPRAGDKCVCIHAEAHNDTVLGELGEAKQVGAYVSSGQFDLMPPGATYLRTRRLSKVDMLGSGPTPWRPRP